MSKPVILTGIRSNEEPTLANYLGAFLPMVNMQREFAGDYQINMFVPDLHSFTTPIDHSALYRNTLNNLKYFIAAGLDLNNPDTYIYRQSYIPAHSELTWILDCFTYVGEMSRMTQFKEKSAEHSESVTVGLFNYPVLMAADILLYDTEYVPVGEDQFQHLEITRDIAERFNNKFGEVFTIPENTKAHYSLGWVYGELNRYEEAIAVLKKVLRLDSNHLDARARLNAMQNHLRKISAQKQNPPSASTSLFKTFNHDKPEIIISP